MPRFSFGPFLLDLESRALLREGAPLPIAGRTLDTLAALIQNRGRLLEKDELLSLIWPGTVVDEANLSQSIFTLRKLLGDSPKNHRYIATIAGRGYQFVAPVTELKAGSSRPSNADIQAPPEAGSELPMKGSRRQRSGYVIAASLAATLSVAAIFWIGTHLRSKSTPSELLERRLTFNSSANEVGSAVISLDGKYLAYSDAAGIHIRLLSTGEERLIPATAVAPAGASSWVDSWFPNGTELLGHSREAGGRGGIWAISIMGRSPRELRTDAVAWSVSPDGTYIAFSPARAGRPVPEIWVMDNHGEHAHKVLGLTAGEFLWSVRWSPSGRRLAFINMQSSGNSLETCDLKGMNRTMVLRAVGLERWVRSLWWLPNGRIVYSKAEAADLEANLWQVGVNTETGTRVAEPRRITHWAAVDVKDLSASADGTRLVLRKDSYVSQVFIGGVADGTKRLQAPQRLTNDEAVDWATAWTPDSKATLFTSNRGGKWGIFKQGIRQEAAQPLIEGRENANLVRVSPDGRWVLYSEAFLAEGGRLHGSRVMRLPLNGGPPRLVYESTQAELQDYPCARSPASVCVVIEADHDERRLTVSALDPVNGKGKMIRTIKKEPHEGFASAMSPDGSILALAKGDEPTIHIRLLSLTGGLDRDIAVNDWPNVESMDWSSDGKGLYCASVTSQSGTLLYVDLRGAAQVVAQSSELGGGAFIAGVPSPDSHYLALTGAIHYSNAWLIEGF